MITVKPVLSQEQALAEVETITDRLGEKVDPAIKAVVAGFLRWNVKTTMSCEGHLDRGYPYPWIKIEFDSLPLATTLLISRVWQSNKNVVFWVIEAAPEPTIRSLQKATTQAELNELQQQAKMFGEYLLDAPDDAFTR